VRKTRGFTLLELMITVAIIGVLVAIAYPSYTDYLVKGNRANAKSFLLDVAQKQQQFLLDNRAYASQAELLAAGLAVPRETTAFYTWSVTLVAGPPPGFQVRATPIAGTRQESDGWLEVDNTGAKTSEVAGKW
jgi:type IV pilus assembly protein PilE